MSTLTSEQGRPPSEAGAGPNEPGRRPTEWEVRCLAAQERGREEALAEDREHGAVARAQRLQTLRRVREYVVALRDRVHHDRPWILGAASACLVGQDVSARPETEMATWWGQIVAIGQRAGLGAAARVRLSESDAERVRAWRATREAGSGPDAQWVCVPDVSLQDGDWLLETPTHLVEGRGRVRAQRFIRGNP